MFNHVVSPYKSENILDSEVGLVAKTRTATQSNAETVGTRKIVKAGTLWSVTENDTVIERGVVLEDYDITHDTAYPISVVFQGRVRADRVAAAVTSAKTELAAQGLYLV